MSATQISFVEFALTEQALCTPSVALPPAALVAPCVAADGGECIPFTGNFEPYRRVRWEDFRRDFYEWDDTLTGGGMDASAYIPRGAHRGFVAPRRNGDLGVLADGHLWSHVR